MEQVTEKTVVKKPDAEKPRAKITHDENNDTIIVIFMPDGRQVTFRMKRDHA